MSVKKHNHTTWNSLKSIWITLLVCNFILLFIHKSYAQSYSLVTVGLGIGGVLDDNKQGTYGFIEYRPFSDFHRLSPWITMEKAEREFYIGIGILIDIKLNDYWILTPSFGAGYYDRNNGIDLGSFLEFRSYFEVARPFPNDARLGVGIGHYSNANFGHKNPGSESIRLTYSIPF